MSVQWSTLAIYFGLLLHSGALLFVNGSCEKQVQQVKADCQAYQRKVMISLREIFEDQKQCSPCPKCKDGRTVGLRPTTAEIERTQRNFQLLAEGKSHSLSGCYTIAMFRLTFTLHCSFAHSHTDNAKSGGLAAGGSTGRDSETERSRTILLPTT